MRMSSRVVRYLIKQCNLPPQVQSSADVQATRRPRLQLGSAATQDLPSTSSMILYAAILSYAAFYIYYKLTVAKCICRRSMEGQTVIVTGANTGIGYETAAALARRGARVILACRNERKGRAAQARMIAATGNAHIYYRHLDLESFRSVRHFAYEILNSETFINVLINNAGTIDAGNELSEDGVVKEAQVNHYGPFLLTMLLLYVMKMSAPSRIINVSSSLHQFGRLNPVTFGRVATDYWSHKQIYANAKLANIMFTMNLSRMLEGSGVTVNCLHPGTASTELYRDQPWPVRMLLRLFAKSARDAAQTAVHLAGAPELVGVSGRYYADCRAATHPPRAAADLAVADRLWRISERITGLRNREDTNI